MLKDLQTYHPEYKKREMHLGIINAAVLFIAIIARETFQAVVHTMEINKQFQLGNNPALLAESCSNIPVESRIDCYPEAGASEAGCEARGCCWAAASGKYKHAPWCFYPPNFPSYKMSNVHQTSNGYSFQATRSQNTFRPNDIMALSGSLQFYQGGIVRLRVCCAVRLYVLIMY